MRSSTGELSREEKRELLGHLGSCPGCAERLREISNHQQDLQALYQEGRIHETHDVGVSASLVDQTAGRRLWRKAVALLVTSGLVGALIPWTKTVVVEAQVTSALDRASRTEWAGSIHPRTYKITTSGQACILGSPSMRVGAGRSSCTQANKALTSASWNASNPLSAKSFETWRKSLKSHHDTISSNGSHVTVRTESPTGPLKVATLRMDTGDYTPVEAKLEFSDLTFEIEAVEGEASQPPFENRADAATAPRAEGLTTEESAPSPADLAESDAWSVLHRLNADTGWEATVRRDAQTVAVLGVVSDDARRTQIIDELQPIEGLKVEIDTYADASPQLQAVLPERLSTAPGKPIAQAWMEEQFPDDEERSKFRNEVREMSRRVLGRTLELETLKASLRNDQDCSACKTKLAPLIHAEQAALDADSFRLSTAISPYIGHQPKRSVAISYADAQQLDRALGALFSGTPETDDDADSYNARVLSLLFR